MTVSYNRKMEGFEIVPLSSDISEPEMQQLIRIVMESLADEALFQTRVQDMPIAEQAQWVRRFWVQSHLDDDRARLFAVRDVASGEYVAWAGLQHPAASSDLQNENSKKMLEDMRDALPQRGREFMDVYKPMGVNTSEEMGYDPVKHFHKRNTLMLPAYHRRGLGTWLTEYCNSIADEAGRPTFVLARPKAWKMLERTGFELQYIKVVPTKQFGWHEDATVQAYRRDPREPIDGASTNAA